MRETQNERRKRKIVLSRVGIHPRDEKKETQRVWSESVSPAPADVPHGMHREYLSPLRSSRAPSPVQKPESTPLDGG